MGGFNSVAQSAGLNVSALMEEMTTATEIVTANCRYMRPVRPGRKPVGTNTASSTSVVAITGPVTCFMALRVAARESKPSSAMIRCTFSTTTMASSTTRPMARISANNEMVLALKPSASRTAKVPISDTGIASVGISVDRQSCRNRKTTRTTRTKAMTRVITTSSIVSFTNRVVS